MNISKKIEDWAVQQSLSRDKTVADEIRKITGPDRYQREYQLFIDTFERAAAFDQSKFDQDDEPGSVKVALLTGRSVPWPELSRTSLGRLFQDLGSQKADERLELFVSSGNDGYKKSGRSTFLTWKKGEWSGLERFWILDHQRNTLEVFRSSWEEGKDEVDHGLEENLTLNLASKSITKFYSNKPSLGLSSSVLL